MTHKPPQWPRRLSMPWVTSARGTSDGRVGQAPVRARLVSLLLRPTAPPLALGVVAAAFLIVAETVLVYLLKQVAPGMAFGVIYLLGVLVISTGWGFGLAVTMSVASALAFDYFHVQPGGIVPDSAADVVVITMFVVVALAANTLAGVARARAAEADQRRQEADQRRREADLAAERAHALAELQAALRRGAAPIAPPGTPAAGFAAAGAGVGRGPGGGYSSPRGAVPPRAGPPPPAHAELTASRARIVAAADDARRRLERDLHDGAQQRLVSLGLQLRIAEASVPSELQPLREQISDIVDGLVGVSAEVQEISRGIHPAILSKGGLGPALKTLARRSTVPVELDLAVDRRLPESAEVAAYYVVAESLTNAAKHARASQVTVRAEAGDANLHLWIRDDGIGGADSANGSGLTGLIDRVEAVGGKMAISSQPGSGTSLLVEIPVEVA